MQLNGDYENGRSLQWAPVLSSEVGIYVGIVFDVINRSCSCVQSSQCCVPRILTQNSEVLKVQWKFERLNPSHRKAHLVCANQLLPATQHNKSSLQTAFDVETKEITFRQDVVIFVSTGSTNAHHCTIKFKQDTVTFFSKCSDKATNMDLALASRYKTDHCVDS